MSSQSRNVPFGSSEIIQINKLLLYQNKLLWVSCGRPVRQPVAHSQELSIRLSTEPSIVYPRLLTFVFFWLLLLGIIHYRLRIFYREEALSTAALAILCQG